MISLKKRAPWGMVFSVVCLAMGIALLYSGHDSFDHAFKTGAADIEKISDDDLVKRLFFGMLPSVVGICLTVLGFIFFPLSLAIWVRNPPLGSKLTFRGWKTPGQRTEGELASEEAWRAIFWGQIASQSWILEFFLGGYRASRSLHSPPPFVVKILLLLIIMCLVFYTLGIRLCRRRNPASVAAAPWSWKFALAINYGGLLFFLGSIGTLFFFWYRP